MADWLRDSNIRKPAHGRGDACHRITKRYGAMGAGNDVAACGVAGRRERVLPLPEDVVVGIKFSIAKLEAHLRVAHEIAILFAIVSDRNGW